MQPSPAHVLIIDDNPINIELASFVLSSQGFATSSSADANEALQRITQQRPDLILMNIQMPGTDGLRLTRLLKADPLLRGIVVVAFYRLRHEGRRSPSARCRL